MEKRRKYISPTRKQKAGDGPGIPWEQGSEDNLVVISMPVSEGCKPSFPKMMVFKGCEDTQEPGGAGNL